MRTNEILRFATLFLIAGPAVILLIGESEYFVVLLATKIVGATLLYVAYRLYVRWQAKGLVRSLETEIPW